MALLSIDKMYTGEMAEIACLDNMGTQETKRLRDMVMAC